MESFGSSGLSHCSPDHQGEIYICLIQILFKTWLFKPGEDLEGVRTRAAAVVRAKYKINKITIQVKIEKITIISCHVALSVLTFDISQVETHQQAVEAECLECQPLL